MLLETPMIDKLPSPRMVRDRLGDALREVELLRGLLRLAERAEHYKKHDQRLLRANETGKDKIGTKRNSSAAEPR